MTNNQHPPYPTTEYGRSRCAYCGKPKTRRCDGELPGSPAQTIGCGLPVCETCCVVRLDERTDETVALCLACNAAVPAHARRGEPVWLREAPAFVATQPVATKRGTLRVAVRLVATGLCEVAPVSALRAREVTP